MSEGPELRIIVPARAENVAVVRRAVIGVGDAMGLAAEAVGDLQTIVTEAAMNVVVHAYNGDDGPLEVTASRTDLELEIAIRDQGSGFRPRPASPERGELRLGLPLIAALSDGFEISGGPRGGTEVRVRKLIAPPEEEAEEIESVPAVAADAAVLSFAHEAPVAPVLSRVIGILAVRADLSIDRLSDSQLLGDLVSVTPAGEFTDGRVDIEVSEEAGQLAISVGPLVAGASERLLKEMELPDQLGGSLQGLASEIKVEESADGSERLRIEIEDAR